MITVGLVTLSVAYVAELCTLISRHNRELRQIRAEEAAAGRSESPAAPSPFQFEYRSKWRLLGLPLVHACSGSSPEGKRRIAKGWIVYGDIGYGAITFGLLSIGGVGLGLLTFAGLGIGYWAMGGCAIR